MPYTTVTINEVEISLVISHSVKTSKWGAEMDKYNVEIAVNNQKEKFEFFMGIGHRSNEKDPKTAKFNVESFLHCIFSDASIIDCFEDDIDSFADDLGDTKPSEAIRAFKGCTESHIKLTTLFGEQYESISDYILENYG
jgi:hypothetical protein